MDAYTFLGSLLIGVALGWLTVAVGFKWVAVRRRQQKADEQRVIRALQQAFAERRAAEDHHDACAIMLGYNACTCAAFTPRRTTYTVVPGSENPIGDGLVVDYFRKELDGGWTA